jgi:hypothetical protein
MDARCGCRLNKENGAAFLHFDISSAERASSELMCSSEQQTRLCGDSATSHQHSCHSVLLHGCRGTEHMNRNELNNEDGVRFLLTFFEVGGLGQPWQRSCTHSQLRRRFVGKSCANRRAGQELRACRDLKESSLNKRMRVRVESTLNPENPSRRRPQQNKCKKKKGRGGEGPWRW